MSRTFNIRFHVERESGRKRSRGPKFKVMACVAGSAAGRKLGEGHSKRCAWGGADTVQKAAYQAFLHLGRGFLTKKRRSRRRS